MEITETITGIPVKNVKWNSIDNVYTGLVKCPVWQSKLHEGYSSCVWTQKGKVIKKFGGALRKDLFLKINLVD